MTIGLSILDLSCTTPLPVSICITGEHVQLEDRVVGAVTAQHLSILDQDLQELYNSVAEAKGCSITGLATVTQVLHDSPSLQDMFPDSDGYDE